MSFPGAGFRLEEEGFTPLLGSDRDIAVERFAGGRVAAAALTAQHHTALFHAVEAKCSRLQLRRKTK